MVQQPSQQFFRQLAEMREFNLAIFRELLGIEIFPSIIYPPVPNVPMYHFPLAFRIVFKIIIMPVIIVSSIAGLISRFVTFFRHPMRLRKRGL